MLLIILASLAADVPIECRVANVDQMCAWASLETMGRFNGIDSLKGLRDYRHRNRGNELAVDSVITAELKRRGVNFKLTKQYSRDVTLLEKYANQYTVKVTLKPHSEWSRYCHAVVVTEFGPDKVRFLCTDVRNNKANQPCDWVYSRAWFDRNWMGGSVVVLPEGVE